MEMFVHVLVKGLANNIFVVASVQCDKCINVLVCELERSHNNLQQQIGSIKT